MMNKISHTGIVEAIEGGRVSVRIMQTSACVACKAAAHCSAAESKEKMVEVFGIPLVVLIFTMVVVRWMTGKDGLAALTGVASLVPYYVAVFLLRGKLARKFAFVIEN